MATYHCFQVINRLDLVAILSVTQLTYLFIVAPVYSKARDRHIRHKHLHNYILNLENHAEVRQKCK